jgi:shikimate kinase
MVVLVGMMGSGKTTVGRALARRSGWRYVDNDELVRAVTGREPEEIDARDGETALHEAETEAIRHALRLPAPLIVGAAAWVAVDPVSVAALRSAAPRSAPLVVYLRATPDSLRKRIGMGAGRRADATDLDWLRARFAERDETYRRMATLTIDTDAITADEVADRILVALGSIPRTSA